MYNWVSSYAKALGSSIHTKGWGLSLRLLTKTVKKVRPGPVSVFPVSSLRANYPWTSLPVRTSRASYNSCAKDEKTFEALCSRGYRSRVTMSAFPSVTHKTGSRKIIHGHPHRHHESISTYIYFFNGMGSSSWAEISNNEE